jgi:hypothetical protein
MPLALRAVEPDFWWSSVVDVVVIGYRQPPPRMETADGLIDSRVKWFHAASSRSRARCRRRRWYVLSIQVMMAARSWSRVFQRRRSRPFSEAGMKNDFVVALSSAAHPSHGAA